MSRRTLPQVDEIVEAISRCVAARVGRRRKLYTGDDLIDDVGLTPDQFLDVLEELEERFGVEIDPDADSQTVAGVLLLRLTWLCAPEIALEGDGQAA